MYTTEFIGRRLYRLRMALKLTVQKMGEVAGVAHSSWTTWEIGKQVPPLKSLINICNNTGIDVESFLESESWLDDLESNSPGVDMILYRLVG